MTNQQPICTRCHLVAVEHPNDYCGACAVMAMAAGCGCGLCRELSQPSDQIEAALRPQANQRMKTQRTKIQTSDRCQKCGKVIPETPKPALCVLHRYSKSNVASVDSDDEGDVVEFDDPAVTRE